MDSLDEVDSEAAEILMVVAVAEDLELDAEDSAVVVEEVAALHLQDVVVSEAAVVVHLAAAVALEEMVVSAAAGDPVAAFVDAVLLGVGHEEEAEAAVEAHLLDSKEEKKPSLSRILGLVVCS